MILKGSQRGGAADLASHLMNDRDNDHVTLFELRGFVARDLHGALQEAHAISKGTQCKQFLFSLSLNPPLETVASEETLRAAVTRAEKALGLEGQPRAIVFHEKEGRRHAHVVWSRIDAREMKAIDLPHYKLKLNSLARDLYLDHGWELPDGLRRDGGKSPLNFTLAEWQQAKRLKLDPREIKQSFQEAWRQSDSLKAFTQALEDKGYFLSQGDRRGYVALNVDGEVFSVPRMLGIKTRDVKDRLGDPAQLPSVAQTRDRLSKLITDQFHAYADQVDHKHQQDFEPLLRQKLDLRNQHRKERQQLKHQQAKRWKTESHARAQRLQHGLKGLWQKLSGSAAEIKRQNEKDAWAGLKRDQDQRDALVFAQMEDRQTLQQQIASLRRKHAHDRRVLTRDLMQSIRQAQGLDDRLQAFERQKQVERTQQRGGPKLTL